MWYVTQDRLFSAYLDNQLSLSEIILRKAFALILVNTNDKSKVGAVCIEERVNHNGVSICSATDSGSQEERQYAFDRIAKLLKHLLGTVPGQISDTPLSYLCPH
jgi:hypothetical protein